MNISGDTFEGCRQFYGKKNLVLFELVLFKAPDEKNKKVDEYTIAHFQLAFRIFLQTSNICYNFKLICRKIKSNIESMKHSV